MTVLLNGVTWRRVQIEISPDEGHAGTVHQHWGPSFATAADSAGLTITLADAIA